MIAKLRAEKGHWVDYVIEFARGIDNLVDFHGELSALFTPSEGGCSPRLNYYFDQFLQVVKKLPISEYIKEVNRYNDCLKRFDAPWRRRPFSPTPNGAFPSWKAISSGTSRYAPPPGATCSGICWTGPNS